MKARYAIVFSGLVWFAIGLMLLYKGLHFIADGMDGASIFSGAFFSKEQGASLLIGGGLLLGFIKGRFVLSKTVRKVVLRIVSLPSPIKLRDIYGPAYYFLILGMFGLGMLLRLAPISIDLRGTIDVAIGSALINGAIFYFRAAFSLNVPREF